MPNKSRVARIAATGQHQNRLNGFLVHVQPGQLCARFFIVKEPPGSDPAARRQTDEVRPSNVHPQIGPRPFLIWWAARAKDRRLAWRLTVTALQAICRAILG